MKFTIKIIMLKMVDKWIVFFVTFLRVRGINYFGLLIDVRLNLIDFGKTLPRPTACAISILTFDR